MGRPFLRISNSGRSVCVQRELRCPRMQTSLSHTNRVYFSGSKESRLGDTCLPSHLDAFDDGLAGDENTPWVRYRCFQIKSSPYFELLEAVVSEQLGEERFKPSRPLYTL